MKKLFVMVVAVAMVLSFALKVSAEENAVLGLSVTFAVDQDLARVNEISAELDSLADEAANVFNVAVGSGDEVIIREAIDQLMSYVDYIEQTLFAELYEIQERRPDLQDIISEVIQKGVNIQDKIGVYIEELKKLLEPRIAIELYPPYWTLEGMKLGEQRSNVNDIGVPMHTIGNTGNVETMVDIGYGPYTSPDQAIVPGLKQGENTFITAVGKTATGELNIIPPGNRLQVGVVSPGEKIFLHLLYGAPTAISGGAQSHATTYELRAYSVIYAQ